MLLKYKRKNFLKKKNTCGYNFTYVTMRVQKPRIVIHIYLQTTLYTYRPHRVGDMRIEKN